jgi:hypothetical protein
MKPNNQYAAMGMAAMLPGMQHMLELMERQVAEFRERLKQAQQDVLDPVSAVGRKARIDAILDLPYEQESSPKRGRPKLLAPKAPRAINGSGGPVKKGADPARVGAASRAFWASMTPEQRSAEMLRRQRVSKGLELPSHRPPVKKTGAWAKLTPEQRTAEMKRRYQVATENRRRRAKSKGAKGYWASMPKKKKAEHIAAMNAARLAQMAAAKTEAKA